MKKVRENRNDRMKIVDAVAAFRKSKGLSQPAMAAVLGVAFRTYQSWELHASAPTVPTARYLKSFLEE